MASGGGGSSGGGGGGGGAGPMDLFLGKGILGEYKDADLFQDLGIVNAEKIAANKTLALTDPTQYNTNRQAQVEAAKKAAAVEFKAVADQLAAAGFGEQDIKREATKAARAVLDRNMRIVALQFPDSATSLVTTGILNNGGGYAMRPTTTRKKATKKKATKKKK